MDKSKYSIVYYFDFGGTSQCEPEVLKSGLSYDEAETEQMNYAEYFLENTFKPHYGDTYNLDDAIEAYAIVKDSEVDDYIENVGY